MSISGTIEIITMKTRNLKGRWGMRGKKVKEKPVTSLVLFSSNITNPQQRADRDSVKGGGTYLKTVAHKMSFYDNFSRREATFDDATSSLATIQHKSQGFSNAPLAYHVQQPVFSKHVPLPP